MYKQVEIFIDGSCLGNPGPGGYSVILHYFQYEKILSNGYNLTTNNRMELMAAIVAIESLKERCNVIVNTDSQYICKGINKWFYTWKKYGWKNSKKTYIKNIDLWQRLDHSLGQHVIQWKWILGHAGHPENERCDKLARAAALNPTQDDVGYRLQI